VTTALVTGCPRCDSAIDFISRSTIAEISGSEYSSFRTRIRTLWLGPSAIW
jgi:hypothetical protein